MSSVRNLVAATPPLYIANGSRIYDKDGNVQVLDFTDTDDSGPGVGQDWHVNITIGGANAPVTMTAYYRKRFDLTGLYNQEEMIIPLANNIQTSEAPLLGGKAPEDAYLREFELWTTVELTETEITEKLLNAYIPTLPGFLGRQPEAGVGVDPTPSAYLDSTNVIAGRARLYVGTTTMAGDYGFMTKLHESVIGEGEPAAAPDLHYVRGFYAYSITPSSVSSWVFADFPAARDILTVGVTSPKDDVVWLDQIDRGAYNDSR